MQPLFALLYHILSFISAMLLVFYISGDWVLLGLMTIFLFELA